MKHRSQQRYSLHLGHVWVAFKLISFGISVILTIILLPKELRAEEDTSPLWGDTSIILGGWSQHTDKEYPYNEEHMSFGVQHKDYFAIGFKNSYNKESLVFGKVNTILTSKYADLSLLQGFVSGYDRLPVPIVIPVLEVPLPGLLQGLNLNIGTAGVVSAIYFKYDF